MDCAGFGPWFLSDLTKTMWEFPKIMGTLFGGPYNKDPTIWGTILGSPILGNPHATLFHKPCGRELEELSNLNPETKVSGLGFRGTVTLVKSLSAAPSVALDFYCASSAPFYHIRCCSPLM